MPYCTGLELILWAATRVCCNDDDDVVVADVDYVVVVAGDLIFLSSHSALVHSTVITVSVLSRCHWDVAHCKFSISD